jgi:hypothetical protein
LKRGLKAICLWQFINYNLVLISSVEALGEPRCPSQIFLPLLSRECPAAAAAAAGAGDGAAYLRSTRASCFQLSAVCNILSNFKLLTVACKANGTMTKANAPSKAATEAEAAAAQHRRYVFLKPSALFHVAAVAILCFIAVVPFFER